MGLGSALLSPIIGLVSKGAGIAKLVLEKSNRKDARKYINDYVEAENEILEAARKVDLEKAKPQEEQFDNIIEHFESSMEHFQKKADLLQTAAKEEFLRMIQEKK